MKSLHVVLCAAFVSAVSVPAFGMNQVVMDDADTSFFKRLTRQEQKMVDECEETCAKGCAIACPLVSCYFTNKADPSTVFLGVASGVLAGHGAGRMYIWLNGEAVEKEKTE